MMSLVAAMVFATVPRGDATQACEGGRARDCREIVQATQALTQMLVTSDPAPLRRYLDRRALWIRPDGTVRSGADLIATVRRDTPRATARLDHVRVRFFGQIAVVTWRESWTSAGARGQLAGVDSWAKRRGMWRIVATAESKPAP